MERGLRAPLSPNEELTLRRVAIGIAPAKDLPANDVRRLKTLALIENRGARFVLTALGEERYRQFHATRGVPAEDPVFRESILDHYLQTLTNNAKRK